MEIALIDRWLHILAGVTWVGLLYYFNFVQAQAMAKVTQQPPCTILTGFSTSILHRSRNPLRPFSVLSVSRFFCAVVGCSSPLFRA